MNYQIVAEEEKLKAFIEWLPDLQADEKYYVCLFSRKKYSNGGEQSNEEAQLKRFVSNKERLLDKIRQLEIPLGYWKLKSGEAPQNSLALYISLNPRSLRKATRMMGRHCWDLMQSEKFNIHAEALSCIQKSKARTCYIDFDIDDKSAPLDEKWLDAEVGVDNYSIVETRGGYHLLIDPEKATGFRKKNYSDKKWYQAVQKKFPIDKSGDQLIPVVGTFQGGFVPKFVKRQTKNF